MLKGPFRSANFSFFAGSVRSIIATVTPRLAHSALFPYIPQRQLSLSASIDRGRTFPSESGRANNLGYAPAAAAPAPHARFPDRGSESADAKCNLIERAFYRRPLLSTKAPQGYWFAPT